MIRHLILALFFISILCNYSSAQQTIPKDTLITLERTFCLGYGASCPWYKLTISAGGRVKFEHKFFDANDKVASRGIIKSNIDANKVKQLISEFKKMDYFSLGNKYNNYKDDKNCPQVTTHHPTVKTSITINRKSKTVEHYLGCEGTAVLKKLTDFENKVEEIVNTEQWLKEIEEKMTKELSNLKNAPL